MPGPLWSAAEDEELRRLYADPSVTPDDLERRFGRSWMAIKVRARAFGLHRRSPRPLSSRPWTEAEEQLLRELYPDVNTPREEIARQLGRTWRSIQHRIGRLGIGDTRERNNPCQVRRDYFKLIDSAEKAYWLGFIAADGCVFIGGRQHTLSISLQLRDRHWLERFRDIIAPGMMVRQHDGPRSCSLCIGSQELVHDLVALGITPRKSNTLEWPKTPEPFVMPFLCGYFDGDGSLSLRKGRTTPQYIWQLLGTYPFLIKTREYIYHHTGVELTLPIRAHKGVSPHLYMLYAHKQAPAIDRALNACGLGLPRKHIPVEV